jgi:hypothetical protein
MEEKTEARFLQASLAMDKSGIQDSFCFRALAYARLMAAHLVDGAPEPAVLYYPYGSSDSLISEQQENFLKKWKSEPEFKKKIKKFSLPLCHTKAEEMIRATLQLSSGAALHDSDIQKAVICACLTPLRQSVGSCFATAPAILVQRNHLDLFVADLYELLTTGRLRRVVEGNEYTVPLSLSFGIGDLKKPIGEDYRLSPGLAAAFESAKTPLKAAPPSMSVEELLTMQIPESKLSDAIIAFKATVDNALLKAWEFTLASFSDVKMEFSKWNLSWGLGLHPNEKGGIGEMLYAALNEKLQDANRKIEELQPAVVQAFDQLKTIESLLRNASSETEARRIRAEEQARLHHFHSCQELQKEYQSKAKTYASLFSFLIEQYTTKFQEYFQEIYDPEMPELFTGPYEDRMAGFRLVYKHGRNDSSLWTLIYDAPEFVKVLIEFFTVTEPSILYGCETEIEKKIVEEMTTLVIQHVQSDRFIHAAVARAAALHRMPWSYLSGGTMDQLIPIYFRYASPPKKEFQEIHDELDLFVFLLDVLKTIPPARNPSQGLLIQSPTHAFSVLPALQPFQQGWEDSGFTYTWIRDNFLVPGRQFYDEMRLTREEQLDLMRRLSVHGETISSATVEFFCQQIDDPSLPAFLFQTLPLIPADRCKAVLQDLVGTDRISLPALPAFLSSQEIQLLAKSHLKTAQHETIAARAKELKLAPPSCIFADTNWSNSYFAFVVNPCNLALEIWKTDRTGTIGAPLPLIKSWLGKGKDFIWTIYTNKL